MRVSSESWHAMPYSKETLWPILSKTDWINRALGLPPVSYSVEPTGFGGSIVTARARALGLQFSWQEFPFEWVEYERYQVRRTFKAGPIAEVVMGTEFQAQADGTCRLRVFSDWDVRNRFGAFLVRRVIIPKAEKDVAGVAEHVRQHLSGSVEPPLPRLKASPITESALTEGLADLARKGQPPRLIALLEDLIRAAPDVAVSRLRPLALAREWKQDEWAVIRLMLEATRSGLLELSWEILCPNCRSTRQGAIRSLTDVKREAHCDVCQINYDAEFDKSVELKFTIHPAVRECELETYCLSGPGAKPHIISQTTIGPNGRRSWPVPPFTGTVRLRSPHVKQSVKLGQEEGGNPYYSPVIICRPEMFDVVTESTGGGDYNLRLINPNPYPVHLVLERVDWDPEILTAARVTNWQEFRDLFAREVISPDEKICVGSQVILFTDLRGSTAMYQEVGDAPAYALVRRQFDVIREAVSDGHGRIVKTIGDAVMAVFSNVGEALNAVERMHLALEDSARLEPPGSRMVLKSSLHVGPCLAVTANERLDFFGSAINLAARMVEQSSGGDVVVSDELYSRPEAEAFIERLGVNGELREIQFRGFPAPQKVWRIPII